MEGHAALPDAQQRERVAEHACQVVEQHIAQPAAQDHPERDVGRQIAHLLLGERRIGPARARVAQGPAAQDADQVSEAVPVDGERPQLQGDGVDGGVGQHGRHGTTGRIMEQPPLIARGPSRRSRFVSVMASRRTRSREGCMAPVVGSAAIHACRSGAHPSFRQPQSLLLRRNPGAPGAASPRASCESRSGRGSQGLSGCPARCGSAARPCVRAPGGWGCCRRARH